MLEQFQVPPGDEIRVDAEVMRATVHDIFVALGMPQDHARQSTDVLLYADLRGIDTHGVSNMLRMYVDWVRDGTINVNPNWHVVAEAPATCTLDSDRAHGGVIGPHAMQLAIDKAKQFGIGAVNVYRGGHFGAAAYTAAMALEHDMIGIAMTAGGLMMTPTFGAEKLIGLNPIAIAVPGRNEAPFVFDASMSGVAGNKVRIAQRLGRGTLPAWIADSDGAPIMRESPIPEEFMHLPLGGTREIGSHKGYGLAVMIEMLTSVLAGAGAGPDRRAGQAHHFLAYRIDAFAELEQFKDDIDTYLRKLREAPPAPGSERVYYAGLQARETEQARARDGIPYHREVIGWFDTVLAELGLANRFPRS